MAAAKAQAARKDCMATKEAELGSNVASATYHAAQTSLRAQEAAKACAAAEKQSEQASALALKANTALALDAAITTAQAFNLVHHSPHSGHCQPLVHTCCHYHTLYHRMPSVPLYKEK